jgi:hypothetical protein
VGFDDMGGDLERWVARKSLKKKRREPVDPGIASRSSISVLDKFHNMERVIPFNGI